MSEHAKTKHTGIYGWLDERTGIDALINETLNEPIPGGARFAYVFGSALIFIFLSQVVTGIFLSLYYVPSADHAHTTVAYITKQVAAGGFIRSVHAYGSSAMVILLLLHITQTFLYGAYKGKREVLWLSGCVLFALVLCMAFTGYLLPWDQKAYFATAVGTNIAGEVPFVGAWIKSLMRGGVDMGTLTLSRFFVAHVMVIPAGIFGVIAAHVLFFRKAGSAGPINEHPVEPKLPAEMFYPRQVVMDAIVSLGIIAVMAFIAKTMPFELGPKANPSDTSYLPRPEWYYIPIFQWLKYWPGALSFLGVVVIPGIVAFAFASLPFLDRSMERRPWKRPIAVGTYVCIFLALFGLGAVSYNNDHSNPVYAKQIIAQEKASEDFMKAPFEPEVSGAAPAAPVDPVLAKGAKLFETQGCSGCHGDKGVGGVCPKLIGISSKYNAERMTALLKKPAANMQDGGMMPSDLPADDLAALVAYIESLK